MTCADSFAAKAGAAGYFHSVRFADSKNDFYSKACADSARGCYWAVARIFRREDEASSLPG